MIPIVKFTSVCYWEGVHQTGKRIAGIQVGDRLDIVRAYLKQQGILVIKLKRKRTVILLRYPVKPQEIAHLSRQLAYLLRAGFSLVFALEAMMQQYFRNIPIQRLLIDLKVALENGMTLSAALRQYPAYFNKVYCHLVEIGETCGNLADQLLQLSDYQEKLLAIKKNIYKALYYPIGLLSVATAVLTLLFILVIPQFEQLFNTVDVRLPYLTRLFIRSAHYIQTYGSTIIGGTIGIIGIFMFVHKRFEKWKFFWQGWILKLPWIGYIIKQAMLARFARTLSTTLIADLPILDALNAAKEVLPYAVYQSAIAEVRQSITAGIALDQALSESQCFSPLLIQVIATGQLSGHLEKNLDQFASFLEAEVNEAVSTMIGFLEPMLILIVGMIIGILMLALYWPIFELGNVVGLS